MKVSPLVLMVALMVGLLAAPLAVEAQQAVKVWKIAFLGGSPSALPLFIQAFQQGLRELGYVEGQNIAIEHRYAEGRAERLPALAAELVRLKLDVIVVDACGAPLTAASQATSTIPIVVAACNEDLVATGLISSLARPGGNITGLSELTPELGAKRLELLKEVVPKVKRVAALWNPTSSERFSANSRFWSSDWIEMRAAAQVLGMTLQSVEIRGPEDLDTGFSTMIKERAEALIAFSDPLIEQGKIVAWAQDGILLTGLVAKARNPQDYEVVGNFLTRDPYSCMVPENDSKWRDFVNHTFMELIDNGKYFELYDKWFGVRGVVPFPMSDQVRNYMIMQSMPE